ncbi:cytochrome c biogenesis protein DipZ [Terricaulis sp.]|uniref:cytochrome c biogenesis protein DipZ n=1 Tax=Terricaulis sp. TaxID=2768686 RepID=UPI003784E3D2
MTLLLLSFLGGVLTILSPCILPVLPFVFARADKPFVKSGLPMLLGMAATFALVATLAAVGGGWVVQANAFGRWLAIALFVVFGLMLLFPALADRVTAPLVSLGNRLSNSADKDGAGVGASVLLGVATGLLWAPCAGPILGLLLTTAAIQGASVGTTFLLLAYALGAATSLSIALLAGGRVFAALKKSLGAGEWIRRGLGVAVLAGAAAIALGLDTGLLTRISTASTQRIEQALVAAIHPQGMPDSGAANLADEGAMPSLAGGVAWLNSEPLTAEQLRGKVVVVDFWTYSCINCLRSLPYVRAWAEKYRDSGLIVIGVHAPEFAFERDENNVRRAVRDLGVDYPVVLDNNYAIWRAFNNRYWPAHYFIDAHGRIRHHHFGEGEYDQSERVIQQLLADAGAQNVPTGIVDPRAEGVGVAADQESLQSPETYVGYERRENFVSPERARNVSTVFTSPDSLNTNQWSLTGQWTVGAQNATLDRAGGAIRFHFHARDLHLVLGPAADGRPVRFRVTIDGRAPGDAHGMDLDAAGNGVIREQRLYQLVRGGAGDRTFEIEFFDPGAQAFAFTFG